MRRFFYGLLWLLLTLAGSYGLRAQEFYFTQLTAKDGIPNNLVRTAVQDAQGFIWLATNEGLSRFDGTQFTHFFSGINIIDLALDARQNLWVASADGLFRKPPETDSFERIFAERRRRPVRFHLDVQGRFWVGTHTNGLYQIDTENLRLLDSLTIRSVAKESRFNFNSVNELADHRSSKSLWLAANNAGLHRFDPDKRSLQAIPFVHEGKVDSLLAAMCLFQQSAHRVWVGTWGRGLAAYDIDTEQWQYFNQITEPDGSRSRLVVVRDIQRKSAHELWICAEEQGLLIFNTQQKTLRPVRRRTGEGSILSNRAMGIFTDTDGRHWVFHSSSSSGDGISILDPRRQLFSYHELGNEAACPALKEPSSFAIDPKRKLLYVTNRGCRLLYVYDRSHRLVQSRALPLQTISSESGHAYFKVIVRADGRVLLGGRVKEANNFSLFYFDP
ncbi:MAG: two-component regulator propeller domain-containing protein, partial [Bacteroidota bacterium]